MFLLLYEKRYCVYTYKNKILFTNNVIHQTICHTCELVKHIKQMPTIYFLIIWTYFPTEIKIFQCFQHYHKTRKQRKQVSFKNIHTDHLTNRA